MRVAKGAKPKKILCLSTCTIFCNGDCVIINSIDGLPSVSGAAVGGSGVP